MFSKVVHSLFNNVMEVCKLNSVSAVSAAIASVRHLEASLGSTTLLWGREVSLGPLRLLQNALLGASLRGTKTGIAAVRLLSLVLRSTIGWDLVLGNIIRWGLLALAIALVG